MTKIKDELAHYAKITKDLFIKYPERGFTETIYGDDELRVMTFNIRRDVLKDYNKGCGWFDRREAIIKMIENYSPDIICMQEVMPHQARYIVHHLKNSYYNFGLETGLGTDLATSKLIVGEGMLTLFKKSIFTIAKKKNIIKLFDGRKLNFRRALETKVLHEPTGNIYTVYNTHFCHTSNEARKKSFNKLYDLWSNSKYSDEEFFLGDFNCSIGQSASGIELFTNEFYYNAPDKQGTINYFSGPSGKTIDFIFSTMQPEKVEVIREKYDDKFLSDHWPVMITYKVK